MIETRDELFRRRWSVVTLNDEVDDLGLVKDAILTPKSVYDDVTNLLVAFETPQLTFFALIEEFNTVFSDLLNLFSVLIVL